MLKTFSMNLLKSMMKNKSDNSVLNYSDAQKLKYLIKMFSDEKKEKGVDSYEH